MDEKKGTLPSNVHENYSTQYKLVCEICSEYENENEKDTDEVKKKRFDKLMRLMQKVGNNLLHVSIWPATKSLATGKVFKF